jgi:putative transposase
MDQHYKRHLPHQVPSGFPIFLTWNLKGAFPREVIDKVRQERERLEKEPLRARESPKDRKIRHDKLVFVHADRFLDAADKGPLDFKEPENAKIVEDAILAGATDHYDLLAWCVMANHVHVLLLPRVDLAIITQRLKGGTSFQINKRQSQRGRVFWQDESYDHWARDKDEVIRIIEYIENNPVAAGLCARPEEWPWSSARFRKAWPFGERFPGVGQALA